MSALRGVPLLLVLGCTHAPKFYLSKPAVGQVKTVALVQLVEDEWEGKLKTFSYDAREQTLIETYDAFVSAFGSGWHLLSRREVMGNPKLDTLTLGEPDGRNFMPKHFRV